MQCCPGRQRTTPSGLSQIRQIAIAIPSCPNRAHPGPSLPGGRRHSEVQRQTPGHERPCACERSIEVLLASGLAMNHGAQLAVDITLRSAVTANGRACPNAATVDGAVLTKARLDKET